MEIAKIIVKGTTGFCYMRKRIPAGLVGGTVSVVFEDPQWASIAKTVIFRGAETRIAQFDGSNAIIPAETVAKPGSALFFGIWGYDAETGLQLPLIEVRIGIVETATDPEADPGADPSLPVWADLQNRVENLEERPTGSGIDVSGAAPGQTVKIAAVDDEGRPTAWAPADFPESGGNVDFRTDETLMLKDGVLSVNTTNDMKQDNTLPITSAGVFAAVGNIEALLKTI